MDESGANESTKIKEFLATKDARLREEVILDLLPLIHFVLGRLGISRNTSQEYDDLAAQGILGLIEAVDRFDEKYNTKLSTFATLKIRGKILDSLREMDWLTRSSRQKVRALQQATNELETKLKRNPTDDEIAVYMNIDTEEYRKIVGEASKSFLSLDEKTNEFSEDSLDLREVVTDKNQVDPSVEIENKNSREFLIQEIKKLSIREQQILSLYYYEELTLKEIGQVMGISESRVSQVHGKAIIKLKSFVSTSEAGSAKPFKHSMMSGNSKPAAYIS